MGSKLRRWVLPLLFSAAAFVYLAVHAVPLIDDGADDTRQAHHAMNDESLILDRVWEMVDRGDYNPSIAVYPAFYSYQVAAVRLIVGPEGSERTAILATRWLSFVTMFAALFVPFFLLGILVDSPWTAAIFTAVLALHPETILWSARVHPDAALILFDHTALALLALGVAHKKDKLLFAATFVAGLAAGTKLMGCFIVPWVVLAAVYQHKSEPKKAAIHALLHSVLFFATFIATTPMLAKDPHGVVRGWLVQHDRNISGGGGVLEWWGALSGYRGLGVAGCVVALAGVAVTLFRRRIDGLFALLAFGLSYLMFVLATVHLVLPRYAFPAIWPLFFVGLAVLHSFARVRPKIIAGAAIALLALYVAVDVPKQRGAIRDDATHFARAMPKEKRELAELLRAVHARTPGKIITGPDAYVPRGIEWHYVWSLDGVTDYEKAAAVVLDDLLRSQGGANVPRLIAGELGFVATATVGTMVLYARPE